MSYPMSLIPRWLVARNSLADQLRHTCTDNGIFPCPACEPDKYGPQVSMKADPDPTACDFCAGRERAKTYRTRDLNWNKKSYRLRQLDEEWAACSICARLLDENHWQELE